MDANMSRQMLRILMLCAGCAPFLHTLAAEDIQLYLPENEELSPLPSPVVFGVADDADDGTEVNDQFWYDAGYDDDGLNRCGAAGDESYRVGLRFRLPGIWRGERFVYARLVLPGTGDGAVESCVKLRIAGANVASAAGFDVLRPSQLPRTSAVADWAMTAVWPHAGDCDCTPLWRDSPDLSAIVNQIIGRPDWGQGPAGKTLALLIEDNGSSRTNFQTLEDFRMIAAGACPGVLAPKLELYRTPRSTFVGPELLGCPTDRSVVLNALSLLTLEAYVEFGTSPGSYPFRTTLGAHPGGTPLETIIDGLSSNTRYYYRLRYRRPGVAAFDAGPEGTFHTQRPPGERFVFTVQSDSHLQDCLRGHQQAALDLYRLMLANAAADAPDFHFTLGDTFQCQHYLGRDVADFPEAVRRHLDQRGFLDELCRSAPLFVVLGNHEGEQGWRLNGSTENVAIWATNARKLLYPLPVEDAFYTANKDNVRFIGWREDYYAWEWGDALFVVLDPYWYTMTCPFAKTTDSGDNWRWTLGYKQYAWLRETLNHSTARFKFVFAHQITGGGDTYGRGGTQAADHAIGGRGSFEWGGDDLDGTYAFDQQRPCWGLPLHNVLAAGGVTIFFHGHDHVFVRQELDGIVYQECPQANDPCYGMGNYHTALYDLAGDPVSNSGHLRVTVDADRVTVDYVRAWLPGDGSNGEVSYSYTINAGE
jgi:hypothetical protein